MKKYFLILLLFSVVQFAFSQDSRTTLGVMGSFDVYSVKYKPTPSGIYDNVVYDFKNSCSTGFRLEVQLTKMLTFRSGIAYSQKGYTIDYNFNFPQPEDPNVPRRTTFKVHSLNFPFLLGLEVWDKKKFKVIPAIGVVISRVIKESEVTIYEDDSERKSELTEPFLPTLSTSQFSGQVNLGLSYDFNDRMFLLFEPFFNYGFSGLNPAIEDGNPILYGGILSLNYKL